MYASIIISPISSKCNLISNKSLSTKSLYKFKISQKPFKINAQNVEEKKTIEEQDLEETTKKWGLEAGLFKAFTSKDGTKKRNRTEEAKELLKKYGSAYLITSITFAIISFTICYILVSSGVDISSLLLKIGIKSSDTTEKVGKVAIAYAAHKAASPIRFPPTVALTPIVANLIGKKISKEDNEISDEK